MRRRSKISRPEVSTITFDKSISDPSNISGDINSGVIAKILSQFRRCLVKKTAEGQVTIAYLRDDNSNYYEDGTAAALTGSEGDVMVYFPEFYYKYEKVDDNRFHYHFACQKIDDNYIKVSESLLGAYEAISVSNKLYSWSGSESTGNVSQSNFKMYASARGKGYGIINYQQHCVIAMMFYAKYGNRNSQAVIGVGVNSYTTPQGTNNARGIKDTVNETANHVSFLGIEAVHGGKYEWVDGASFYYSDWTITDPDGTDRSFTAGNSLTGWIVNMKLEEGPYFDLIPMKVSGGSETTHYSDYYHMSNVANNLVLARSYNSMSANGGVSSTSVWGASMIVGAATGSRLAFYGEIVKATSINDFKKIPLTN